MRIGVDATCWQNTRGYGRHARTLLRTLVPMDAANQYTFVLDDPSAVQALPAGVDVEVVSSENPTALAASADGSRSLSQMWNMSRALSSGAFDLVFFPTIYSYVPVWSRARKVVAIHDTIPEAFPELTTPDLKSRLFWKAKTSLGRAQSDAILTVSEYSRRCILERFNVSQDDVFVAGEAGEEVFQVIPGVQPTKALQQLGIASDTRFLVYVGGFGPHKNLDRLIGAFARLVRRDGFEDVRLVMVGEYEKEVFFSQFRQLKDQIEREGIGNRVLFTGYIADADLVVLLNLATLLVLPSLMEGFGLPAVEAASCGCPVVATTASPLPDILGEGGIYVDPRDDRQLDDALVRVLGSPELHARMKMKAKEAADALNWEDAARQVMNCFETVMAR